jgi:multidrug efflux pump subunit AcrA (membrane-fusion protein)
LTVPATAVVERGPLTLVYVADAARTARLRYVTLGARHADRVEVLSGLARGERVVVAGTDRLADGVPVSIGP